VELEEDVVTFTKDDFIKWLSCNDDINIIFSNTFDDPQSTDYGKVSKAQLETITTLEIKWNSGNSQYLNWETFRWMDLSELSLFPNLQTLIINGTDGSTYKKVIENITFPSTLTSLTITNCEIKKLDLSGCTELKEFVSTNNTIGIKDNNGKKVIDELSSLCKLETVTIENSDMEILEFSTTGPAKENGLTLSVINCSGLKTLNFGGYFVKDDATIRRCTSLDSLVVNGYTSKNSTLNLSENTSLKSIKLSYYFNSDDHVLKLDAAGISIAQGADTSFTLERKSDSKNGKYAVDTIKNSYIDKAKSNIPVDIIDYFTNDSGEVAFIVFAEDKDNFEKKELWKTENNEKIRNFEKNPVRLLVGQEIKDDRVYFYNKYGARLDNITYTITPTNTRIPDELTDSEKSSYQVISVDTSNKNKVTAENAGNADLTVKVDGQDISATQKISVYTPVKSVMID